MSHFGGVDPMEKWKRKQDVKSGNEIITYRQKLEKMTFTKGCQICNQSLKNYQTERRKVPERPIEK
jgi:hypothetical protein